jgi:hypothetical protein
MAGHKSTPSPELIGKLTPEQIEYALSEVSMRLSALDRVSILLQCDALEDARDIDAMHTLTQCVLRSTGHLVELVAKECGGREGMLPKAADPLQWQMPPLFFPTIQAPGVTA